MLRDLDRGLKSLLTQKLIFPGSILSSPEQIIFSWEQAPAKGPFIAVILNEMRENLELRGDAYRWSKDPDNRRAQKRRPPVWMDLGYVVAADGNGDPFIEHQILSDAARTIYANEILHAAHLAESVDLRVDLPVRLTIVQPDHSFSQKMESIWRSWSRPMRASLPLIATGAFDPSDPLPSVPLVQEIITLLQASSREGEPASEAILHRRVGSIFCYVTSENGKEALANVRVTNDVLESETDSNGFFCFLDLPPGEHKLVLSKDGYEDSHVTVRVDASDNALAPKAQHVRLVHRTGQRVISPFGHLREADRRVVRQLRGTLTYDDGSPASYIPVRNGTVWGATNAVGSYCLTILGDDEDVYALLPTQGEVKVGTDNSLSKPFNQEKNLQS